MKPRPTAAIATPRPLLHRMSSSGGTPQLEDFKAALLAMGVLQVCFLSLAYLYFWVLLMQPGEPRVLRVQWGGNACSAHVVKTIREPFWWSISLSE